MMFLIIKLIGISYVTVLHVVLSLAVSKFIDIIIPNIEIDPNIKREPLPRCISLIFLNIILVSLAFYLIRNIVDKIPFPLNNMYGYNHSKLKERNNIILSSFLLSYYQTKMRARIDMVFKHLF